MASSQIERPSYIFPFAAHNNAFLIEPAFHVAGRTFPNAVLQVAASSERNLFWPLWMISIHRAINLFLSITPRTRRCSIAGPGSGAVIAFVFLGQSHVSKPTTSTPHPQCAWMWRNNSDRIYCGDKTTSTLASPSPSPHLILLLIPLRYTSQRCYPFQFSSYSSSVQQYLHHLPMW